MTHIRDKAIRAPLELRLEKDVRDAIGERGASVKGPIDFVSGVGVLGDVKLPSGIGVPLGRSSLHLQLAMSDLGPKLSAPEFSKTENLLISGARALLRGVILPFSPLLMSGFLPMTLGDDDGDAPRRTETRRSLRELFTSLLPKSWRPKPKVEVTPAPPAPPKKMFEDPFTGEPVPEDAIDFHSLVRMANETRRVILGVHDALLNAFERGEGTETVRDLLEMGGRAGKRMTAIAEFAAKRFGDKILETNYEHAYTLPLMMLNLQTTDTPPRREDIPHMRPETLVKNAIYYCYKLFEGLATERGTPLELDHGQLSGLDPKRFRALDMESWRRIAESIGWEALREAKGPISLNWDDATATFSVEYEKRSKPVIASPEGTKQSPTGTCTQEIASVAKLSRNDMRADIRADGFDLEAAERLAREKGFVANMQFDFMTGVRTRSLSILQDPFTGQLMGPDQVTKETMTDLALRMMAMAMAKLEKVIERSKAGEPLETIIASIREDVATGEFQKTKQRWTALAGYFLQVHGESRLADALNHLAQSRKQYLYYALARGDYEDLTEITSALSIQNVRQTLMKFNADDLKDGVEIKAMRPQNDEATLPVKAERLVNWFKAANALVHEAVVNAAGRVELSWDEVNATLAIEYNDKISGETKRLTHSIHLHPITGATLTPEGLTRDNIIQLAIQVREYFEGFYEDALERIASTQDLKTTAGELNAIISTGEFKEINDRWTSLYKLYVGRYGDINQGLQHFVNKVLHKYALEIGLLLQHGKELLKYIKKAPPPTGDMLAHLSNINGDLRLKLAELADPGKPFTLSGRRFVTWFKTALKLVNDAVTNSDGEVELSWDEASATLTVKYKEREKTVISAGMTGLLIHSKLINMTTRVTQLTIPLNPVTGEPLPAADANEMGLLGGIYALRKAIEEKLKVYAERITGGEPAERIFKEIGESIAEGGEIGWWVKRGEVILEMLEQTQSMDGSSVWHLISYYIGNMDAIVFNSNDAVRSNNTEWLDRTTKQFLKEASTGLLWKNLLSHLFGVFAPLVKERGLTVEYSSTSRDGWDSRIDADTEEFLSQAAGLMRGAVENAKSFVRLGIDAAREALVIEYDGPAPASDERRATSDVFELTRTTAGGVTRLELIPTDRYREGLALLRELFRVSAEYYFGIDPETGKIVPGREYVHDGFRYWLSFGQRLRPPTYIRVPPDPKKHPSDVERYWEHPDFKYDDPYAKKMAAMKPVVLETLTPQVAWPSNVGETLKVTTELGDIDITLGTDGYRLKANNGKLSSGLLFEGGRLIFGSAITLQLKKDNVTQEVRFNVPLFARPTTEILNRPPPGDMTITSKYKSTVYVGVSDELLRTVVDDHSPTAWTLFHVPGGEPFMGLVKVGNHEYPHDQIDQHGMMGRIDHNFAEALRAIRGVIGKTLGGFRIYKLERHNKLPEYQTFDIKRFFESRGIGPIIDETNKTE